MELKLFSLKSPIKAIPTITSSNPTIHAIAAGNPIIFEKKCSEPGRFESLVYPAL
jgi:hypothetical protein